MAQIELHSAYEDTLYEQVRTGHLFAVPAPPSSHHTLAWFAAALEIAIFGTGSCALIALRGPKAEAFQHASPSMGDIKAWMVAAVLFAGSLAWSRAAYALRRESPAQARSLLLGTVGCGLVAVVLRVSQCATMFLGHVNKNAEVTDLGILALHALHVFVLCVLATRIIVRSANVPRPCQKPDAAPGYAGLCGAKERGDAAFLQRLERPAIFWHAGTFVSFLLVAYPHGTVVGLGPWNLSWSSATVLSCTMVFVVLLMAMLREDSLHLSLVAAAVLLSGTGATVTAARGLALASAEGMWLERPADPLHPFEGTANQAKLRAEVGVIDLGQAKNLLATMLSPPVVAQQKPPATAGIAPDVLLKARHTYEERCASCHGPEGKGDGLGAFAIKPPPRDYTDVEWQASVTDEELAKAITLGGVAVGKSYMMPASTDLRAQPKLIEALVAMVRSFGEK